MIFLALFLHINLLARVVIGEIVSHKQVNVDSLVAVQVIFRHGARTIEKTFPSDPYGNQELWPNGFHQLTCEGKIQCYNLGRLLRERYDGFINSTYIRRDIHVSSSDVDRTIQSAYSVIAGLYPPNDAINDTEGQERCRQIVWKDVPVHNIPAAFDNIIRQEAPCPRYDAMLKDVQTSGLVLNKIYDNREYVSYFLKNANVTSFPSYRDLVKYYDALVVEKYNNFTLSEWTQPVLDSKELKELNLFYFETLCYTEEMTRLRTGPLLNRVLRNFHLSLNGDNGEEHSRRMYMFSGHDLTITTFLKVLNLYTPFTRPSFASCLILELHRVNSSVELCLFYRNETDNSRLYRLEIPGCGNPCKYLSFIELLNPYELSADAWKNECRQTSALEVAAVWGLVALAGFTVFCTVVTFVCTCFKRRKDYTKI